MLFNSFIFRLYRFPIIHGGLARLPRTFYSLRIIETINTQMNTTIQSSFSDPHIFDVFTIEFLLACIENGDYVDPNDVKAHLPDSKARNILLDKLSQYNIV